MHNGEEKDDYVNFRKINDPINKLYEVLLL